MVRRATTPPVARCSGHHDQRPPDTVSALRTPMPNGLAPSDHVLVVSFDAAGRPVVFEVEVYSESDGRGIDDLIDLDRNGRADLTVMNYDDGSWITNIYSAIGGRWRRASRALSNHDFPLYSG